MLKLCGRLSVKIIKIASTVVKNLEEAVEASTCRDRTDDVSICCAANRDENSCARDVPNTRIFCDWSDQRAHAELVPINVGSWYAGLRAKGAGAAGTGW